MARFWNKINLILEDCRSRIRAEVKSFLTNISREKGDELEKLSREFNCKLYLALDSSSENPVLIVPVLFVQPIGDYSPTRYFKVANEICESIFERIGGWASDYRLNIRPAPRGGLANLNEVEAIYGED